MNHYVLVVLCEKKKGLHPPPSRSQLALFYRKKWKKSEGGWCARPSFLLLVYRDTKGVRMYVVDTHLHNESWENSENEASKSGRKHMEAKCTYGWGCARAPAASPIVHFRHRPQSNNSVYSVVYVGYSFNNILHHYNHFVPLFPFFSHVRLHYIYAQSIKCHHLNQTTGKKFSFFFFSFWLRKWNSGRTTIIAVEIPRCDAS